MSEQTSSVEGWLVNKWTFNCGWTFRTKTYTVWRNATVEISPVQEMWGSDNIKLNLSSVDRIWASFSFQLQAHICRITASDNTFFCKWRQKNKFQSWFWCAILSNKTWSSPFILKDCVCVCLLCPWQFISQRPRHSLKLKVGVKGSRKDGSSADNLCSVTLIVHLSSARVCSSTTLGWRWATARTKQHFISDAKTERHIIFQQSI